MVERERAREADRSGRRKDQRIVSIDEYNQRDPRGGLIVLWVITRCNRSVKDFSRRMGRLWRQCIEINGPVKEEGQARNKCDRFICGVDGDQVKEQ